MRHEDGSLFVGLELLHDGGEVVELIVKVRVPQELHVKAVEIADRDGGRSSKWMALTSVSISLLRSSCRSVPRSSPARSQSADAGEVPAKLGTLERQPG